MKEKILIVEDDIDIIEILKEFLSSAQYNVTIARDGFEGFKKFKSNMYDLIILDVLMPKIDGFTLCEMIRCENKIIPIIILTALDDEDNEIKAFDLNIDDYIEKPFSIKVLLKRVENVLRKNMLSKLSFKNLDTTLTYKNININIEKHETIIDGKKIELTLKEYELLYFLIKNKGKILSRELIFETVWRTGFFNDSRVIDTHIKNLRKKLNITYIKTIRGIGYEMEE